MLGKTHADLFTFEHARAALRDEQEILRTRRLLVNMKEKETWPDGRETWFSTTKLPLRDLNRQIIGTFGLLRDILDKKRAEEKLAARWGPEASYDIPPQSCRQRQPRPFRDSQKQSSKPRNGKALDLRDDQNALPGEMRRPRWASLRSR